MYILVSLPNEMCYTKIRIKYLKLQKTEEMQWDESLQ